MASRFAPQGGMDTSGVVVDPATVRLVDPAKEKWLLTVDYVDSRPTLVALPDRRVARRNVYGVI